jgi:ribosomal-protein-alanine N-acetyltransferase
VADVLITERLTLRPATTADYAVLQAHWDTPDVRRFLFDGTMLSRAEITETIAESQRGFATAGYSLAPSSWGQGYATEAARAVVEHALGPLGLPEVLAEVDEGNAASVAVVKRLGMTAFGMVPGVLGPMTRYRRTARSGGTWPGVTFEGRG